MSSLTAIDSFSFSFFGDTDKPIEYYFPPSPVVPTSTASLDQPKESSSTAPSPLSRTASLPVPPQQAQSPIRARSRTPSRRTAVRSRSPSPRRSQIPSKRSRSSSLGSRSQERHRLARTDTPARSLPQQSSEKRNSADNGWTSPPQSLGRSRTLSLTRTEPRVPQPPLPSYSTRWKPSAYLPTEFSRPSRYDSAASLHTKPLPVTSKFAQRDLTPLTEAMLLPSLKGLDYSAYSPYLLKEPIELAWSSDYYRAVDRFLSRCADKAKWRTGGDKEMHPRASFAIVHYLQSHQPDKLAIRRAVGTLGYSLGFKGLPEQLHFRVRALRDVMRWLWEGTAAVSMETASWLILESSRDRRLLPVYILLREHASTLRFSDYIEFARAELLKYLETTPPSRRSPRESRALTLLQWLNEDQARWYSFFAGPDRSMRGSEPGEWWLREPKEGEKRDKRALDDWERETSSKEDWRARQ